MFPDYIICLNDGLRFRTLRRHLMAAFGLTPEQYAGDGACPTTSL
ncbi:MAG: MucR family transcriptional regulator [Janthinobacterium lividum]